MVMATTVTTSQSWFSRLGSSVKNVFIGFILVIGSIVLLFWNEGRAVKTEQSLKEGASAVVSVSSETKNPANEGKLIHFEGEARTPSVLTDVDFGVGGSALKLKRIVEVYQWEENFKSDMKEKLGGGTETTTTYTYKQNWSDRIIDSSNFKESEAHKNPTTKRYENKEWLAANVSVGAYEIPEDLLMALSGYQPFTVTSEMLTSLPYATQGQLELTGNMLYLQASNSAMPQIGNTRIRYEIITPQMLSVISQQSAETLVPYVTKNGRTISMIQTGSHTAAEMFEGALSGNRTMTWIIRLVGTFLMYIGLRMIFGVLPIVASVIPVVGRIVGTGMSLASGLLTLIGASVTIAVAWIVYRPLIGIILLLVAVIGVFLLIRVSKSAPRK
jgi:hypothetical protein